MPPKAKKKKVLVRKKIAPTKKISKKAKKLAVKPKVKGLKSKEKILGKVTHYFPKVFAAVIKLKAPLAIGEAIRIKGHTTDFTFKVESIQLDHQPVKLANKGKEIGLLVKSRVREHDIVYKV